MPYSFKDALEDVVDSVKSTFKIKSGAAAAIVTSGNLSERLLAKVDAREKFVVHPHVASVSGQDTLLNGYLRTIYGRGKSLGAAYPAGGFTQLATGSTVEDATRELAIALAMQMSKRRANPGILFGFLLDLGSGDNAHGVIKADLDDEQRFHFELTGGDTWSIDEVRELLPPPRAEYAKFAISPQPGGDAEIGVHDVTDAASAADYFLGALGLTVARTRGTQALIAQAALTAGYPPNVVRSAFRDLREDRPVEQFVAEVFPEIPEKRRRSLAGSSTRPMPSVLAGDPYISVYWTRSPYFRLEADGSVNVEISGRVVTVTLPENSDPIEFRARR